jgi:HEAT repeat protein
MDAPPTPAVANIPPEPTTDEAIAIPVRVIPPETPENQAEAILAEVLPDSEPEPQEIGLSDNERRSIIEQIEVATNDDLDLLLELAIHTDTLVRLYAVQKLGILGDPSVEAALTEAYMEDVEMIVRRAARLSLNKLGLEIPVVPTPVEENISGLSAHE